MSEYSNRVEKLKDQIREKEQYIKSIEEIGTMYDRLLEYHRSELLGKNEELERIEEEKRRAARLNHRFSHELELARKIQLSLLPQKLPEISSASFHVIYKSMAQLCGDYYDIIPIREPNLFGIFVSDVSGHGAPAALITAMIKILLQSAGKNRLHPAKLLQYINNSLLERIHLYFITAFYAIYNSQTRILRYAAGAHPPPFLLRKGIISEISGSGGLIGVFPDAQYSENEITLEPGDRIIIYTDGLIEAVDDKKIPFGNKLSEVLQKCGSSVNDSIEYLYAELIKHRGAEKFDDDVCILGMKISEETPGG